ncbi:MAG: DUF4129 domain-containing protein [Chloroflexi bacterium]|nr:DUF4129 domain-containing protein [Chloroflexota bacterium]
MDDKIRRMGYPIAVVVMVDAIGNSLVQFGQALFPAWNGLYLQMAILLAGLEAITLDRVMQRRKAVEGPYFNALRFHLIEWGILLLLLKLLGFVFSGAANLLGQISLWQRDPLSFFTDEYIVGGLLIFYAWEACLSTTRLLRTLSKADPAFSERREILENLRQKFLVGGLLLLMTSGMARWGAAALLNLGAPALQGVIVNALLYFGLGLALFSQVHLTGLSATWQAHDTPVSSGIVERWTRASLIFLGLVAFLALLLPAGYSIGILETIQWLLWGVLLLLTLLYAAIFFVLALIWALIASLLLGKAYQSPPLPPMELPPLLQSAGPAGGAPPWWKILRALLFWIIFSAILIYLIRSYLQDRPGWLAALARLPLIGPLWRWLVQVWQDLRQWVVATAIAVLPDITRKRVGGQTAGGGAPGVWWRRYSPREQAREFYLSLVRRAGQKGLPRFADQTAFEYSQRLRDTLPAADPDLELLTQAFVEARYSAHPVSEAQVGQLRQSWQRLRRLLGQWLPQK